MLAAASSDLEETFRLNISFDRTEGLTIETKTYSDRACKACNATKPTKWRNTKRIGQGASSTIWLQHKDDMPLNCGAVKEIIKKTRPGSLVIDYSRELVALGRLSKVHLYSIV